MTSKNGPTKNRVVDQFKLAYADIHAAADLASKMSGDGTAENFTKADVIELQRLTRSAGCHALSLYNTWDGSTTEQH